MKIKFSRYNFLGLFGGLALLILPIFFDENFNGGWFPILIYMILITSGVIISVYFFAKILNVKYIYFFAIVVFFEIGIYSSIHFVKNHQITSTTLIQNCRNFYAGYLRNIPAYQIGLGQYDPDLFYTLKPNNSDNPSYAVNSNIEFSNRYKINSQGTRDNEASLHFPEIIVLGDSHTMGWGVEQDETFSNLLEQKIEKKVLNTGIVSYGTAREYLMFQKLKTDSCNTIILQYCSNDLRENQSFVENGNQLEISSEEEYQFKYKRNFLQANYYPFKFCFETIGHQFRRSRHRQKFKNMLHIEFQKQIENFFSIVELLIEEFDGEIIIFNLESHNTTDKYFLAFKKYVEEHHLEKIQLIDFSKVLNEYDYFIIDGHINVSGHRKVSDTILENMKMN